MCGLEPSISPSEVRKFTDFVHWAVNLAAGRGRLERPVWWRAPLEGAPIATVVMIDAMTRRVGIGSISTIESKPVRPARNRPYFTQTRAAGDSARSRVTRGLPRDHEAGHEHR